MKTHPAGLRIGLQEGFVMDLDQELGRPEQARQSKTPWKWGPYLSERQSGTMREEAGRRPVYGATERFQNDVHWKDYILFFTSTTVRALALATRPDGSG